MWRTTIYLDDEQATRLNHHSQRTGRTQADIIRTALSPYLNFLDEEEATRPQYVTGSEKPQPQR